MTLNVRVEPIELARRMDHRAKEQAERRTVAPRARAEILEAIAHDCGFKSLATMRAAVRRAYA